MKKPARSVGARKGQVPRAAAATAKATLQMFKRAMEAQQRGRLAEAENLYNAALKHEPRHVPALLNLATLLRILGRVAESHAVSERAVAAAPEDALAQFALGVSFRRQRRDKEAIAAYEKALTIDPGLIKAWTNLAVSAERAGPDPFQRGPGQGPGNRSRQPDRPECPA